MAGSSDKDNGSGPSFAPGTPSFGASSSLGPSGAADSAFAGAMTNPAGSGFVPASSGGTSRPNDDADISGALYGGVSPGASPPDLSSLKSSSTAADTFAAADEASAEGDFTEVRSVSWLDKLKEAVGGVLVGLLLVAGTAAVLFWNEGRAVQTARSLTEGAGLVHDVPNGRVDPANEGKLVHVQGDLTAATALSDPALGMEARAARLVRTVEMFQWKEESRTETHKKVGGGEDRVTTYTYTRVWADRRNESERFHNPSGHTNPAMRYARTEATAADASLGSFRPGATALERLPADTFEPVRDDTANRLRNRIGIGPSSISDGSLYLGQDPASPRVGDLRITYHVAPLGPVSFVGRQVGLDVQEYPTRAGDRLLLARPGLVSAETMFARAQSENAVMTWVVRLAGTVFMWVGFSVILRPIAVLGDVVPFIGSVLGAGTALAAFLLTLVVAPVVIGTAWLFYRPLVGITILLAGAAAAYGIRHIAHGRVAARSAQPPLAPARA